MTVKRQMEYKKRLFEDSQCSCKYQKSKKILSMKVSDEHVHDGKVLPQLVEDITKSKYVTVGKVFADGAYDSNAVFECLAADSGILSCIN